MSARHATTWIAAAAICLFAADSFAAAKAAHLTSKHSGWRKTDCFSCHEGQRVNAKGKTRKEFDCVPCHGYNGAPHEAHAVPINPCANCHSTVGHLKAFQAPDDCISCHVHPDSPQGR
ncbi:MAG: hypothetical protein NTY02_06610 [Acidobacteria bacterium]|nr:hypothetical protein [Acidobacteriota bacterium]